MRVEYTSPSIHSSSMNNSQGSPNATNDCSPQSKEQRNVQSIGQVQIPPGFRPRPCSFFAKGTCRNGNECRFSHDPADQVNAAPIVDYAAPPPPVIINIPPGQPVFSIDVECVATGVQHTARSIAQVALVDEWCRPIFNVYIKQDVPVLSYISELTGLSEELLDQYGMPLGKFPIEFICLMLVFIQWKLI